MSSKLDGIEFGRGRTLYEYECKHFSGDIYFVLRNYKKSGSYLYKAKTDTEARQTGSYLSNLVRDDIQVVMTNAPEAYVEYHPYTEVEDIRDFVKLAIDL